jgi:hypothetical protein
VGREEDGVAPAQGDRIGRVVDDLLADAHLAAPHELPGLLARHAQRLGADGAVAYLADLQLNVLVPFLGAGGPELSQQVDALGIDSTVAGRSFQHLEILTQDANPLEAGTKAWLPLLTSSDRLGVLAVTLMDATALDHEDSDLSILWRRFASLAAELIMTKTLYGDTIVRLRRRAEMGLAAEIQWSLLPPLTFATDQVSIAAALEPAYEVAGDSVDYAVDAGRARFAIFDGMGHSMQSAQLASVTVAAYRNARRAGRPLDDIAEGIDAAVGTAFTNGSFTTAVLAELSTDTGLLNWVSAGHPEPLLLRGGQFIKSLHVEPSLPFGLGPFLGNGPRRFVVGAEQLEPGDQILLYTDGVIEARSPSGDVFGLSRLTDLLSRTLAVGLPASESMRRLIRSLRDYHQDQLSDDATMLLAEWR